MDEMQNVQQSTIARMQAVTLSREYGSGGGEVAHRLATHLGWHLIDHEVVGLVAQQLGISEADAEARDERVESFLSRFLSGLQAIEPMMPMTSIPPIPITDAQAFYEARRKVIEGAVATGHVVIVGRGAQVVLAQRRDVLHVRIVAPFDMRTAYVVRREGLDQAAARTRIQTKDRERIRYLQEEHQQHPEDPHLYDLVLNSGILDLNSIVDLISLALERKSLRLSIPSGELGPVAGLSRYPEQPVDFRLLENEPPAKEGKL